MKPYHKNPRKITTKQADNLRDWLAELGDLSGIVHDLNTDEIIGGNQRGMVFDVNKCEVELIDGPHEPDEQGTVAHGFIVWKGARYAYRQVRWDDKQAEKANIVANKAGGGWDFDTLANEFEVSDLIEWGFEAFELGLGGDDDADGNNYVRKIEPPIYTPKGDKPKLDDLFDMGKTHQLIGAIDKAENISEGEKEFLRLAAYRHTVLRFDRIADYYAHSDGDMQSLMEDNALVIIDFDRAIELGFVEMTKEIAELVRDEYGDD